MIIDLTEEEREFLHRICDRAQILCQMVKGKTEFYREPWNWISDLEKVEILLAKLEKKE